MPTKTDSPPPGVPQLPEALPRQSAGLSWSGPVGTLFQWLVAAFNGMPLWVRVTTYLFILLLFAYRSLLPSAISGSMMQRAADGRVMDNHTVAWAAVWADGVVMRVKVVGPSWRVPVVNSEPWRFQNIFFYDAQDNPLGGYESSIPALLLASSQIDMIYDEATGRVRTKDAHDLHASLLDLLPLASARAQSTQAPLAAGCGEPCRQVAHAADVPTESVHATTPLDSLVAPRDLDSFRRTLARRVSADPRTVDWSRLRTVSDFASLAQVRGAAGNISSQVKNVLAATPATTDLRLSFGDGSPQLRTARASMNVPADETVLGLLNATITGDGAEGMLFGTRGIYYHTSWMRRDGPSIAFISYDDLADRALQERGSSQVSLDQGQYFVTTKSSMSATQLVDVLGKIQDVAKAHRAAATAAAMP